MKKAEVNYINNLLAEYEAQLATLVIIDVASAAETPPRAAYIRDWPPGY